MSQNAAGLSRNQEPPAFRCDFYLVGLHARVWIAPEAVDRALLENLVVMLWFLHWEEAKGIGV